MLMIILACASGPAEVSDNEALLEEYEASVEALHELADAYVVDIEIAAFEDIDGLQAAYLGEMEHGMEDLEHAIEEIAGCEMDDMQHVDDAEADVAAMQDSLDALAAGHLDHAAIDDCIAAAEAHEVELDALVDGMAEHHDAWHDDGSMMCAAHEDGAHDE